MADRVILEGELLKRLVFPTLVFVVMAAAFFWRLFLVYELFGEPSGCGSCLVASSAISDAPFLISWIALSWFGFTTNFRLISQLCRVISVVSLLLYVTDIYVMSAFFTRLYVTWVINVGATPGIVFDYLKSSSPLALAAFLFLFGMLITALFFKPKKHSFNRTAFYYLVPLVAVSSIAATQFQTQYVHAWATDNVFITSQFSGVSSRYSDEYLGSFANHFESIPFCRQGVDKQQDVIVLILESWSAYHSDTWGGAISWTPELDSISKKSMVFQRTIAGGFNTNQGLMSIISGVPLLSPLTSLFSRKAFEPAWGWDYTLPKQLASGGYRTAFLTSGDLSFHGKAAWIEHAGFDYIEGHDASVYEGHPRRHFNAAPDDVLFSRAVDYWNDHPGASEPLAIVVESVSSHTPFIHPLTGEKGEEPVIRYMDEVTGSFFRSLESAGYFSHGGLLVIASDHRSMTVIREEEGRLFGDWAPALVPMLIYGEDIRPQTIERVVHQSDITPSLAGALTEQGCGYPGWRNLFREDPGETNSCVFHASGTDWEKLLVFCDRGHGVIELDGDQSRFLATDSISISDQQMLLKKVAYFRSEAQANSEEYLSSQ